MKSSILINVWAVNGVIILRDKPGGRILVDRVEDAVQATKEAGVAAMDDWIAALSVGG